MIESSNSSGVWRVRLNHPQKANALTLQMLRDLRDVAKAARQDPELRAFILTGTGGRVFCSGADMSSTDDMHAFTRAPEWHQMSGAIAALPCLTIAALNGTVAGGGFAPVLACDLRICTPEAKFFYPVLKRGFLPQPSDVTRLKTLIGSARAKLILMAGQKLTAPQALAFGLTDRVVPAAGFEDTLNALIADACGARPQQVAAINKLFADDITSDDVNDCYLAAYDNDAEAMARIS